MSNKALTYVWEKAPYESTRLLVLLAIADFADDDGVCFPGVTRLAAKARLTPRALQKHLAILEQDGWLKRQLNKGVETGRGKTNRYTILPMFNSSGERQDIPMSSRDVLMDTRRGERQDTRRGESASSPKPSVEPSVEPSVKDIAPAEADADSTTLPEVFAVKETETASAPVAPIKERKSSGKKKESASRPRNPIFDALAQHLFGVAPEDAAAVKAVAPRVGKLLDFAKDRVTPEEMPRFVAWYQKHFPKTALPLDSAKFATHWTAYAKARDAYAAQQSPTTLPVQAADLWDMRAILDHMDQQEGKLK